MARQRLLEPAELADDAFDVSTLWAAHGPVTLDRWVIDPAVGKVSQQRMDGRGRSSRGSMTGWNGRRYPNLTDHGCDLLNRPAERDW